MQTSRKKWRSRPRLTAHSNHYCPYSFTSSTYLCFSILINFRVFWSGVSILRPISCLLFVCHYGYLSPTHLQLPIGTTTLLLTVYLLDLASRFSGQLVLSRLHELELAAFEHETRHSLHFYQTPCTLLVTTLDPCIQTPHLNSWFVCNFTDLVNMSITWFQDLECGLHHIRRNDEDQANSIIERPSHFKWFNVSCSHQKFEDRRLWPRCRVDITT